MVGQAVIAGIHAEHGSVIQFTTGALTYFTSNMIESMARQWTAIPDDVIVPAPRPAAHALPSDGQARKVIAEWNDNPVSQQEVDRLVARQPHADKCFAVRANDHHPSVREVRPGYFIDYGDGDRHYDRFEPVLSPAWTGQAAGDRAYGCTALKTEPRF